MADVEEQMALKPKRGIPTRRVGKVVSQSGVQTIKVRYQYSVKHPKYGKYMRRSTTLHTHDEKNEAKLGDVVEVTACRRMSKTKCWRLTRILRTHGGEGSSRLPEGAETGSPDGTRP